MYHDGDVLREIHPSKKSVHFVYQRRLSILDNVSKALNSIAIVNTRCARYSFCFRTSSTVEAEKERQLKLKYFVLHPYSYCRFMWETFMVVIYIAAFLFLPFEACNIFYTRINPKLFTNYGFPMLIFHIIFIIDMVLNFYTGYVDIKRKQIILDLNKIACKYLKTYFIFDVLSTIPALVNAMSLYFGNSKVFWDKMIILNFLKIARLLTFSGYVNKLVTCYDLYGIVYKVVKLCLLTVFFFHWTACLMFVLPFTLTNRTISVFSANTWIHAVKANLGTMTAAQFYLSSLFNAINLTLSCQATRRPQELVEVVTSIFVAIFGLLYNCFLYVFLFDIIRERMEPETKYDEFITQLRDYMRHNQLPTNIQQRMYLFYEHRYQRIYFREDAIMSTLSERMRKDISDYGCRRMMVRNKLFKGLTEEVRDSLVNQLSMKMFLPKDVICKARGISRHVYFLSSGTVAVYTVSGNEVCHLYDGSYFGELSLLMRDHKMIAYITALEICEVYLLEQEVFLRAVATNPEVFDEVIDTAKRRIKETRAVEAALRSVYEDNPQKSDILLEKNEF